MTDAWQRHDLLRIDPPGWRHALSLRSDLGCVDVLPGWADRGWPVMVRRYLADEPTDRIPVAISLPPKTGKGGVALQLRQQDVIARFAPTSLIDVVSYGPSGWKRVLQQLTAMAARFGSAPAVFGSLLWQWLTGMTYLHEGSDLDLIWRVSHAVQAQQLAAAIDGCAARSPMRIDGEFILPNGGAVHWREFHSPAQHVLVKTLLGVELVARQRLFCL